MATASALAICLAMALYGCGCGGGRIPDGNVERDGAVPARGGGVEAGPNAGLQRIVLGGGCFWCMETVMELVDGVAGVTSGYAGGETVNPTYEEVCTGDTGHAEVVAVDYDPAAVSLEKLLEVFFAAHDPTSLNRQGADAGSQYRSVILYTSPDQEPVIRAFIEKAGKDLDDTVVTEVAALERFYAAEEYHQDYYAKNPGQPYCSTVISPKVEKARKMLEGN